MRFVLSLLGSQRGENISAFTSTRLKAFSRSPLIILQNLWHHWRDHQGDCHQRPSTPPHHPAKSAFLCCAGDPQSGRESAGHFGSTRASLPAPKALISFELRERLLSAVHCDSTSAGRLFHTLETCLVTLDRHHELGSGSGR
jgi:hypothetical protein